jgi:phosphate:Na+ symporter
MASSAATLFAAGVDTRNPSSISWGLLIISLFGGLALFLYGMEKMSEGMKKSAGNKIPLKAS